VHLSGKVILSVLAKFTDDSNYIYFPLCVNIKRENRISFDNNKLQDKEKFFEKFSCEMRQNLSIWGKGKKKQKTQITVRIINRERM